MDKLSFLKLKVINFIIQILILSLLIYVFNYKFKINFDKEISPERQRIIQFLANYIMFNIDDSFGIFFIYLSWIVVSLIPIFNFQDYKAAYSTNLYTFFFPNFFFYIFLSRYSPNYFKSYFLQLLVQTLILGLFIIIFSISLSFLINKILRHKKKAQLEDFKKLVEEFKFSCPYCGTEFNSLPQYCYNCLKEFETSEKIHE
jgi:hypothetical protein